MGGFFGGGPSAPTYTPPPAPVTTDPEEEARKERLDAMARNRRGRAGMIATSDSGVLAPADSSAVRTTKTLLGE
ncbi:MAG TPA: hypothetical protein VL974_09750 [Magnetospirillum sp.]|nr:hypothetical protein [Magnetospirillum sp.]